MPRTPSNIEFGPQNLYKSGRRKPIPGNYSLTFTSMCGTHVHTLNNNNNSFKKNVEFETDLPGSAFC